nr:photosystem II protein T [Schisandra repanda]UJI65442.1 photosystem II protein T [Schisandra repanda]
MNRCGSYNCKLNHDRIYGSIGLYIPLSLDSRDNFFRHLFSRTA